VDYMSVRQAAEKWGVSIRQVQALLRNNRVEGAVHFDNHAWSIPADAEKPGDPRYQKRKASQNSLFSELSWMIAEIMKPMPLENPDAILDSIKEERLRLHYENNLDYLRGDYERILLRFQETGDDDASKLLASLVTMSAAMSLGNYDSYREIESYLLSILSVDAGADATAVAELSLNAAYIYASAHTLVADWLKRGDFTALPPLLRTTGAFCRARYCLCLGKYERALDIAQTALISYDTKHEITNCDIYLQDICVKACYALNRIDEARQYLSVLGNACLPHGFITPFVEARPFFGSLLEQHLELNFPELQDVILRRWQRIAPNWVMFHNQFMKDNIPFVLSAREVEIAQLVARGKTRTEIAKRFYISTGRLNQIINKIYGKLSIQKKDELAKYLI